ncbi:MAG: hypothetical protein BWY21_00208 [Parcubacteria group bacterium ADurb.Bin216]|nr:MAG: hypothetical protein BWY21_00208 [Parcubacteria group bacterium ADurb.Bin216]
MERFENVKTSINNADNIRLLFPKNPSAECLSSVLALYFALKKMGKKVNIPLERVPDEIVSLLSKETKKILISFGKEVSEVYYDKEPNGLQLTIIPKNENFSIEDLSMKVDTEEIGFTTDELEVFDLVIAIGLQRFDQIDELLQATEEELFDCTIINIDTNLNNEAYGDINIIEGHKNLLRIISIILKQLGEENLDKTSMHFLVNGFMSQEGIHPESVPILKWLIRNGGDFTIYYSIIGADTPEWINDFAEIIVNSSLSEDKKTIYSYLDKEGDRNRILQVIKIFHEKMVIPTFFIAFKDNESRYPRTIFRTTEKALIDILNNNFEGQYKENGGVIDSEEETPQNLIKGIKEVIEKTDS